jgi:hypothetical protein
VAGSSESSRSGETTSRSDGNTSGNGGSTRGDGKDGDGKDGDGKHDGGGHGSDGHHRHRGDRDGRSDGDQPDETTDAFGIVPGLDTAPPDGLVSGLLGQ